MKPQNIKERRSRFLKFLLLFLLTTALLLGAFYFDYKVPVKENEEMRKTIHRMERDQSFQKDFSKSMIQFDSYMEALKSDTISGLNELTVERKITDLLDKMVGDIPEQDSIFNAGMYNKIIKVFFDSNDLRKELKQMKEDFGEGNQLRDELLQNRKLIDDLKKELQHERLRNRPH